MQPTAILLQQLLNRRTDNKKVFGTSFCIKYKNLTWCGASGNLHAEDRFFIASTTKLFVTAVLLNLRSRGLLTLEDPIGPYLPPDILKNLHTLKGKDSVPAVTIKHLLSHTSGIPDYFQLKRPGRMSLEQELKEAKDQRWTWEEAIRLSKELRPRFFPGAKGKGHYSDTNFQLLGQIIEIVSGQSVAENYQSVIFRPLGLSKTYEYSSPDDRRPVPFYFRSSVLSIPQAMASFGPDGGIVSTSEELMRFLQAFFGGVLFPAAYISELKEWNPIFFPMQSGIGIHRFKLPWLMDPFGAFPELFGHSGLSGTLAYCNPEKDLYITGTVNQIAYPETSFRLALQLVRTVLNNT